jgi:hypothetical protein
VRLTNAAHLAPWIPIALAASTLTVLDQFVVATDTEFAVWDHLRGRAFSRSVLTFVLGWLVAFGPALFVVLFDWRAVLAFFKRHRWTAAYLAGVAAIGWAGSLESERHALNWGAPVLYLLIGRAVADRALWVKRPVALAFILIAQLVVHRVFWTVPQPGDGGTPLVILTPVGASTTYLDLFPDYLPREVAQLQLFQHAVAGLAVLAVMRSLTRRSVEPAPIGARATDMAVRGRVAFTEAYRALAPGLRQLGMLGAARLLVPSFVVMALAGGFLTLVVRPPRPVTIHVRWTTDLGKYDRAALERELDLTNGRKTEGTTWAYELAHPSTDRIRAIVTHPAVEDTEHVNRIWFRPRFSNDRERLALFYGAVVGGAGSIGLLLWTAALGSKSSASGTKSKR